MTQRQDQSGQRRRQTQEETVLKEKTGQSLDRISRSVSNKRGRRGREEGEGGL